MGEKTLYITITSNDQRHHGNSEVFNKHIVRVAYNYFISHTLCVILFQSITKDIQYSRRSNIIQCVAIYSMFFAYSAKSLKVLTWQGDVHWSPERDDNEKKYEWVFINKKKHRKMKSSIKQFLNNQIKNKAWKK